MITDWNVDALRDPSVLMVAFLFTLIVFFCGLVWYVKDDMSPKGRARHAYHEMLQKRHDDSVYNAELQRLIREGQ